jgi:endoglucanase
MTHGFLAPEFETFAPAHWATKTFQGSASLVVDSKPDAADDVFTVMILGHSDKIRMQVTFPSEAM